MEQKSIAILLNKIVINEEIYIFKPLHVLEGAYDQNDQFFIDNYGNEYISALESHLGLTETTEFFGLPISLESLQQLYKDTDLNSAKAKYFEEINERIYIGYIDFEDEIGDINIVQLPIESLKELFYSEDVEERMELDGSGKIEVEYHLNEEFIQNMLKMKTLEELKGVLNNILEMTEPLKEELNDSIKEQTREENKKSEEGLPFNIREMYEYVTSKVINQDEAVKKIIMNFSLNFLANNSIKLRDHQPTRTLITGPTGVGKTLILETMLEYLEKESKVRIPMVKVPTSQLTVAGYVGLDLEDVLEELVSKAPEAPIDEKIYYAEKNGLVFFDEIDKKGSADNGNVSGRGVLNSLLQFLDGSEYEISIKRMPFYFNTKYLNIFASGAFTNVNEEINRSSIGFGNVTNKQNKAKIEDYITKGQMPSEFMGRFHQIVELNPLKELDLQSILKESTASPILVEKEKLMLAGINLTWDDSFVEEVAKRAYNLKLGARSLKTIIEEALFDLKWENLLNGENATIEITKETVLNPKQYKKI